MTGEAAGNDGRAAVLLPGGSYGPDAPLLKFAGLAARQRGALVQSVSWDLGGVPDLEARVTERTVTALHALPGRSLVLIGKSLGSLAASVAAERGLPAVWFTPLLTEPEVVAGLRKATGPFLLVGGTGDDYWQGAAARALTAHVVEIPGADHGMFVPGPLASSAAVLGEVITAVERFLDDVVWP